VIADAGVLDWRIATLFGMDRVLVDVLDLCCRNLLYPTRCKQSIHTPEEEEESAHSKAMSLYFGTLPDSCVSLYQSISGGVNWGELLRPMVDDISPSIAPLFTFYIAFSILAMMNVVTGVFVESALQSLSHNKEENLASQLQEWCVGIDSNNDGDISLAEFDLAMQSPVDKLRFENLDLSMQEARKLIILLDWERTGQVPMSSFIMGCLRLRGCARSIDVTTLLFEQKRLIRTFQLHAEVVENALSREASPTQTPKRSSTSSLQCPQFQGRPNHLLQSYAKR